MELNRLQEIAAEREVCDFCSDSKDEICVKCTKVKGIAVSELREYHAAMKDVLRRAVEIDTAMEAGRLVELPFVAMVEQSLQGGEMKPERDQRFNGRYAVVYSGKGKWGCPLIDICGTSYNSDQAEERKNEITCAEAEAAFGGGKPCMRI